MTQANDIIFNCQADAGWYPLETLSVDGCLETALDCYWKNHPELESLVKSACERVASKWSSSGDVASAAQDWALDLVPEYAQPSLTAAPNPMRSCQILDSRE